MDSSEKANVLLSVITGNVQNLKDAVKDTKVYKELVRTIGGFKTEKGFDALHLAAKKGDVEMCDYLLNDLCWNVDSKDWSGASPLLCKSRTGDVKMVNYLLDMGADPNAKDKHGFSPLHGASERGENDVIALLIWRGSTINDLSNSGTPLQRAAGAGKHEAVKILLEHDADPRLYFSLTKTPLAAAIDAESLPCVNLLVKEGADLNAGSCWAVPLVMAASAGNEELVRFLVDSGADREVIDDNGMKPIEIAASRGKHEIVEYLLNKTTPIPTYSDWSLNGLFSEEAKQQREVKVNRSLAEAKSKGDEALRNEDYLSAIFWYTKAINENPLDATMLSNRSLCWACLKEGDRALSDAQACVMLKPEWPEAYYREGAAWNILERLDKAVPAFRKAVDKDRGNDKYYCAYRNAHSAQQSLLPSCDIFKGSC